jgi:hypothetical protein
MPCTPVSARVWGLRRASGASRPSPRGRAEARRSPPGGSRGRPRTRPEGGPPAGRPPTSAGGAGRLAAEPGLGRGAAAGVPGPPAAVPRGRPWTAAPWAWLRGGHGGRPGAMGPGHHRPGPVTAPPVVAVCTARGRPEEACRDHHQRLGRAECRAWTTAPSLRPVQGPLGARPLLRLRQARVDQAWGEGNWGASQRGTAGSAMPRCAPAAVWSGGTGRSGQRSWGLSRRGQLSLSPPAWVETSPGWRLQTLATTA